ncbi:MAG: MMPL family transporter, partial [Verrucomicrobiales bacterium]
MTKIRGRDGVLETDHLVPNIPTDPSELDLIRADALYQRLFHGEVISDDGNTAAVNLFVADKPDDPHFNNRLTAEVQAIIDREAKALGETVKIYQTGVPTLKVTMMEFIQRDMMRLLPFSFLVVFSTLFFLYRSVSAVVIPAVTGLVCIV